MRYYNNFIEPTFFNAMEKEVASMFKDCIWKVVPRNEMIQRYAKQR